MAKDFNYIAGTAVKALEHSDYYIWDCSVVKVNDLYHMFSSRWKKELGFGWNWLFNGEIVHSVSTTPMGPYEFKNVVIGRRDCQYFDGMSTHNTCIKHHDGKYYLYYMGTTFPNGLFDLSSEISNELGNEIWNKKRIGVAVANDINGEYIRKDKPLLEPRDCRFWDCTITTNPSVAILPSGKTYMIYKSRKAVGKPLQLGIAVADTPDGKFERISDRPILEFSDENLHVEDPFFWYDEKREKFCLLAKDDSKNGSYGITGQWGNGFYAESDDCINFEIAENPLVYSRNVTWQGGTQSLQGNLERPSILFDENGVPTHLFCASGNANTPYDFSEPTFIVAMNLIEK